MTTAKEALAIAIAELQGRKGAVLKEEMWRSFRDNDFLTVKIWDLVRDAFYEGRELGPWPETLTEDDKNSAWLGSKSREQTQESFPRSG